jgi:hypothetical protein
MTNLSRASHFIVAAALLWPAGIAAQQESVAAAKAQRGGRGIPVERSSSLAPQGFSVVLVLGEMQGTVPADNVPPAARKALADMKDFLPYKSYRLLDTQWTLCCGHSVISTRLRGPDEQDYDLELDPKESSSPGKWNVRFTLRDPVANVGRGESPSADRTAVLAAQRAEMEQRIRTLRERYSDNHPEVQQLRTQIAALDRQLSQVRTEETMKRYRAAGTIGRRAMIDTSFTMDIGETVVVGTSRLKGDKALIALLTAVASTKTSSR